MIAACTSTAQPNEEDLANKPSSNEPSSTVTEADEGRTEEETAEETETPQTLAIASDKTDSQPKSASDNSPSDAISAQATPIDSECDSPQTQLYMNLCAEQAYKRTDAILNQTYRRIQTQLSDSGKQSLTEAELAWINFRDLECDFSRDQFEGGSIAPLIYHSCLASYTEQRTGELQDPQLPQMSYETADKQLNQAYERLLAQLSETRSRDFVSSQLAWIKYRDRHCEFEVLYGAVPIEENQCLARMSDTRTEQILQTIENNSL